MTRLFGYLPSLLFSSHLLYYSFSENLACGSLGRRVDSGESLVLHLIQTAYAASASRDCMTPPLSQVPTLLGENYGLLLHVESNFDQLASHTLSSSAKITESQKITVSQKIKAEWFR